MQQLGSKNNDYINITLILSLSYSHITTKMNIPTNVFTSILFSDAIFCYYNTLVSRNLKCRQLGSYGPWIHARLGRALVFLNFFLFKANLLRTYVFWFDFAANTINLELKPLHFTCKNYRSPKTFRQELWTKVFVKVLLTVIHINIQRRLKGNMWLL